MDTATKTRLRKLLIVPPLLAGAVVLVFAVQSRVGPERAPPAERVTKVRVIEVPRVTLVPRALGYGNVRPGAVWRAVAEVGGKIAFIHPRLKKGAILAKNEVLLRIDPTQYRLAIAEFDATIRAKQAQLEELAVRESNTRASLAIDERSLALSRKDLERKRALLAKKAVAQAAVDGEERNVLAREQSVQSLRNSLNLIPSERRTLEAETAMYRAQMETARLDLDRTTITAPFDCRIAEVNVEETQYAAQGAVLVVADSIGVSEVDAQVPMGRLANLMPRGARMPTEATSVMEQIAELVGLQAVVRLSFGKVQTEWPARFARIRDSIDPETRTVGVVVAVDDPYGQVILGVRPPLAKNMFVAVELRGRPVPGQVVVPRTALHGGHVYVVGAGNRLEMRAVEVRLVQTGFAAIGAGLEAGEKVVVSDLVPAVEGMLLAPVVDEAEARALIADAEGDSPLR